jgi:hypothetical protein
MPGFYSPDLRPSLGDSEINREYILEYDPSTGELNKPEKEEK